MSTAPGTHATPWLPRFRGKFVVFEGPDGSGKSTILRRLVALAQQEGVPLAEVREPGGTPVGEKIRAILLDKAHDDMALRCEMLLYMASRAQLVERVIAPALAQGRLVLADRFVASTYAYQGAAGGLASTDIDPVAAVVCREARPDLTLVFDVDEETAAKRAGIILPARGKRAAGGSLFADRMEDRDREFRRRVRRSYLDQAAALPARFRVINAAGTPEQVWLDTLAALAGFASTLPV